MKETWDNLAARAAPAVFVVLWSSGFIGTKYALSGAEPLTFLTIRMSYVVVSVTLETKAEQTQQFKNLSPRLKQAVLQRLMAMSVRQELRPGRTDPGVLRDNLFDSLTQLQEEGLKDVVITRLLYS